jgi:methyltransferase (TIGR00027 family)
MVAPGYSAGMRGQRASRTAVAVAVARGIGISREHVDPVAAQFIGGMLGRGVSLLHHAPARLAARVLSGGLVDHITLRTTAIDRALAEAVHAGASQLVVLGAGLDARAFRTDVLGEVDVIEVDHPATQRHKSERIGGRSPRARSLTLVAVDFERDDLDTRLAEGGHDRDRPTVWIWEGVTPYLVPLATDATLQVIGARSARGSRAIVTYALRALPPFPVALRGLVRAGFSALGEPLRDLTSPEELAARLDRVGFSVIEDTDSTEWARRVDRGRGLALTFSAERLAVAHKR